MAMISSGDLARMRAQAEALLDTTCTIQSRTATTDSQGGFTNAWATAASAVPCRLNRYDRREDHQVLGERANVVADWVVSLAHDRSVTIDQRIVIGSLTLEPVWVNTGKSVEAQTRVVCREIT